MDAILARIGVQMRESIFRSSRGGFALDINGKHVAHRRLGKKFLLGRIEPLDAKEIDVRFTNKGRFAPKTNKLGRALADDACDDHTVNAAGRRGRGSVEIGIAIHPQKVELPVVAASSGKKSNGLRAISAKNEDEGAAFYGDFRACFEVGEAGDNFGYIAGAAMFVVISEKARSAVAVVNDFETGGLQAFDEAGGT
jgi:hypothetical protein